MANRFEELAKKHGGGKVSETAAKFGGVPVQPTGVQPGVPEPRPLGAKAPVGTEDRGIIGGLTKFGETLAPLVGTARRALDIPFFVKQQKEAEELFRPIANRVIAKLKDPDLSKERKRKLFDAFKEASPEIIEAHPDINKTAKQILGEAIVTGVTAVSLAAPVPKTFVGRAAEAVALGAPAGAGEVLRRGEERPREIVKGAAKGAAIGVAAVTALEGARLAARFFGSVSKRLASTLAGEPREAIETIIARPEAARMGLREPPRKTLRDLSNKVRKGISDLLKGRNREYQEGLEKITEIAGQKRAQVLRKEMDNLLEQVNRAKTPQQASVAMRRLLDIPDEIAKATLGGAQATKQAKKMITDTITDVLDRSGVKIVKKGLDFSGSPFRETEERALKKIFNIMKVWDDTTPVGVNKLAVKIGKFKRTGEQNKFLNQIIDNIRRNLRSATAASDELIALNRTYSEQTGFIKNLNDILKTKGALTDVRGIRKTSEAITRLFNRNKDLAREAVEQLEKRASIEILGREAGRRVALPSAREIPFGGKPSLIRGLLETVVPPRVVGEIAAFAGTTPEILRPLLRLKPATRAILFRLFGRAAGAGTEQR